MNGHEQEIARALREMADRAATPSPRIEAAWRAGRQRRRTAMTASVAGAAGVTAAAVLVPMAVIGGTGGTGTGAAGAGKCDDGALPRPAWTLQAIPPKAHPATTQLPTARPATARPATARAGAALPGTAVPALPPRTEVSAPPGTAVPALPRTAVPALPTARPATVHIGTARPRAVSIATPAPAATICPPRRHPAVVPILPGPRAIVPSPAKVRLDQVASVVHKPCPKGSPGLPALSGRACYYVTGQGMTADIGSAKIVRVSGGGTAQGKPVYIVQITLARSDAAPFLALTSRLQHLTAPHNELAWIVNGKVVTSPAIQGPMSATFQLSGPGGMTAQAQRKFLFELEGLGKPLYVGPPVSLMPPPTGKAPVSPVPPPSGTPAVSRAPAP